MELGPILALLAAACFGVSTTFVRRGVVEARESFSVLVIGLWVGTLFFSVLLLCTSEWNKLWSLSWQGFVLLGAAGIIHFIMGRFLYYSAVRLIGANRASGITRTSAFYAVTLGVLFLNEPLTMFLIFGVLCLAGGATLISVEKGEETSKIRAKGILAALGAAFCWGLSGVLIKPAVEEIGSTIAGALISYVAASIIAILYVSFGKKQREQLIQLRRATLIDFFIAAVFTSAAQLLRYVALSYSPVSVVEPLLGTSVLFTLLLSFVLIRKIEVFTWKVILGIVVTVVGTFLLFR